MVDNEWVKLTADSLTTHLSGTLLPAYLISGDEPLLAGEAADAVRQKARAAGFVERDVHFIERATDWDAVWTSAANLSLFGARRVLEIRLTSAKPGAAGNATLSALLAARAADTLLLILSPRLDRDAQAGEWVRALEARGGWVQIWPVDPQRLVAWLAGRCRSLGLEPEKEALELLAARTEGNLLAAHQELTKLTLFAPGGRLTAESVLASVADSARFDVFELGEAVLSGDTARALRILAGLRAEGTEATLALWALTRSLRDLWNARSGGSAAPAWQRRGAALAAAAKRAPAVPFGALAARAARTDRVLKGRIPGDAWDELALLTAQLSGQSVLGEPRLPRSA